MSVKYFLVPLSISLSLPDRGPLVSAFESSYSIITNFLYVSQGRCAVGGGLVKRRVSRHSQATFAPVPLASDSVTVLLQCKM